MTTVRQGAKDRLSSKKGAARKAASSSDQAPTAGAPSRVAQVRLQADELEALQAVMRQLGLPSTSEALREGIRLLIRDAAELAAAEEIRRYYGEQAAPLPDGVIPATPEELAAADAAQW